MSSAKWHPASGQFGIFGDVQPGSPEERAAKSSAEKGLTALEEYRSTITGEGLPEGEIGRQEGIEKYYEEQQGLTDREFGLRRQGVGFQQERLGLQRGNIQSQESSALGQFLGDAYSFRQSSDVQKATGGLYSGEQERGAERRGATMSDMMRSRQEGFSSQMQGLDISSQELNNQLQGMDIAQARSISDLLKARGIEMAGIDDLLYQIETEQIAYEGAT